MFVFEGKAAVKRKDIVNYEKAYRQTGVRVL